MTKRVFEVDFAPLSWEPNFERGTLKWWRPAPNDYFGNTIGYCREKEVFPIRAVLDSSGRQVVEIMCWAYENCRICANIVSTSYDDTEFRMEELRKIELLEWKWRKHLTKKSRIKAKKAV